MKKMRAITIIATLLMVVCLAMTGCSPKAGADQLEYEGSLYTLVEFNQDIFSCGFGMEGEFETDVTYPVENAQFDMVHNNGDLYCNEEQVEEANRYYQDDANYDWKISLFAEDEEEDPVSPIEVTAEELDYIYQLENQEKDKTLFFDDIGQQATLIKVSKDGVAWGSMELALYEGQWYWRSAVIDESQEKDGTWPEYIYPMPESFQDKIKL